MHKWIGTDNGSHCYRCGMELDYGELDEASGTKIWTERTEFESEIAHNLAPYCSGPETNRAHHFLLAAHPGAENAYFLECAYGDCTTDEGHSGGPAVYNPECVGG
jgi:hypothetical protein